jgi:hypothetical protein
MMATWVIQLTGIDGGVYGSGSDMALTGARSRAEEALVGDLVEAARAPWIAAEQAPATEHEPAQYAVLMDGLYGVL